MLTQWTGDSLGPVGVGGALVNEFEDHLIIFSSSVGVQDSNKAEWWAIAEVCSDS